MTEGASNYFFFAMKVTCLLVGWPLTRFFWVLSRFFECQNVKILGVDGKPIYWRQIDAESLLDIRIVL